MSAANHPAYVARIVHNTPGRLRLRLPRQALADEGAALQQVLASTAGVQMARVTQGASSLLVLYDPATVSVPALSEVLHAAGVHVAPQAEDTEQSAAPHPAGEHSLVSQLIGFFTARADARVGTATHGWLNLRTVVPMAFGVMALREILSGRLGAAPWYTLLWWMFDSYLKLHPPPAEPPSPTNPTPSHPAAQ